MISVKKYFTEINLTENIIYYNKQLIVSEYRLRLKIFMNRFNNIVPSLIKDTNLGNVHGVFFNIFIIKVKKPL